MGGFMFYESTANTVQQLMDASPVTVSADDSVAHCMKLMRKHSITSLIVAESALEGVLTSKDILLRMPWARKPPEDVPAEDVMSSNVKTLKLKDTLSEVLEIFDSMDKRIAPVLEDEDVAGVITRSRLVRHFTYTCAKHYCVGDLMNYRYSTASLKDGPETILDKIIRRNDKYVIVLDEDQIVGTVTASDILAHIYDIRYENQESSTQKLMRKTKPAKRCDPCTQTAKHMIKHSVSALPVTDQQRIEGIIRYKDFYKPLNTHTSKKIFTTQTPLL